MNDNKNNVVINQRLDYNHTQIVRMFIFIIQNMYDINPRLIEKWLNKNYENYMKTLDESCYKEIDEKYKKYFNKLNTMAEKFDDKMRWQRDKCGHVLKKFNNGYIKYCNQHKYLHHSKSEIDHTYVEKKDNDIIDEQYLNIKYNLYVDYTRTVAGRLADLFINDVINKYKQSNVSKDNLQDVLTHLKKHPDDFKNKKLINNNIVLYSQG